MERQYIYIKENIAKSAYVLLNGTIKKLLNEKDFIDITGKPFFFGVSELLLSEEDGKCPRFFSVRTEDPECKYQEISFDDVKSRIKHHVKGFKIAQNIAEILIKLDKIHIQKREELGGQEKISQHYAKLFTQTIDEIGDFSKENKYFWLEKLYEEGLTSMTYAKGKALKDLYSGEKLKIDTSFWQLDDYTKKYPRGAYICQQGEDGDELYILRKGLVKVYINGHVISEIEKPGTIIGEMIFLMQSKRTASMQAVKNTSLAVIKKEDLKKILMANPNFLHSIALNISRRIQNHCAAIEKLNKEIALAQSGESKEKRELKKLRLSLSELYLTHNDVDWLNEASVKIAEKLKEME